jgi:hypothetical protein
MIRYQSLDGLVYVEQLPAGHPFYENLPAVIYRYFLTTDGLKHRYYRRCRDDIYLEVLEEEEI